ncbi:MAG: TonB-dependent receptor plug domain-containing protein [Alphaproteobacteria bacterium]
MKFLRILLAAGLLTSSAAYAQENELGYLMSLDIEDLVQVSVASKKEESLYKAPAIVSVVTQEDLRRYGGNNLRDVLNRLPNMQVFGSGFTPNTALSIRGQTLTAADSHVLFLMNGRPVRESHIGGFNNPIYMGLPIEAVQKIEVIRGPGSILYGTNAFSGVVNIVTKTAKRDGQDVSVGYGSLGTKIAKATFAREDAEKDYEVYVNGRLFQQDGWDFSMTSPSNVTDTQDYGHDAYSGVINARYKDFTVNGLFSLTHNDEIGLDVEWPLENHRLRKTMFDIGYDLALADWDVGLNATYNGFENKSLPVDHNRYDDYLLEVSAQRHVGDDLHLLFGSVYEWHLGSIKSSGNKVNQQWHTMYGQVQYQMMDWLKLIGGVQMNNPEQVDAEFSPRAGAIIDFTPHIGMKLLYGEAFRSPYGAETSINIPGIIVGNPQMKPEKIKTSEAQLFYHKNGLELAATYYESIQTDALGNGLNADGDATFINRAEEVEYNGVEFEAKYRLDNDWLFEGSASYQKGVDKETNDEDVGLIPHFMTKWGASYAPMNQGYLVGVHASHFGDAGKVSDNIVNTEADAYTFVSANFEMDVNKIFDIRNLPQMTFTLYGENLLDEDIYFPEHNRRTVNTFPLAGGRAVYGTLKVSF